MFKYAWAKSDDAVDGNRRGKDDLIFRHQQPPGESPPKKVTPWEIPDEDRRDLRFVPRAHQGHGP